MGSQDIFWDLWPGIFPRTSCFGVFAKKMVWMGADGWKPDSMGAYETGDKEERKNKGKRAPNGREGDILWSMHTVQRTTNVVTMGIVFGDGHSEKFGYNKGCAAGDKCVYANRMQQNNQRCQKKRKRVNSNAYRQLVYKQMEAGTKWVKNSRRNLVIIQRVKSANYVPFYPQNPIETLCTTLKFGLKFTRNYVYFWRH